MIVIHLKEFETIDLICIRAIEKILLPSKKVKRDKSTIYNNKKNCNMKPIILQMDSSDLQALVENAVRTVLMQNKELQNAQNEYLTMPEAAQFLKMSESRLYNFTALKRIPFTKKGKRLLFNRSVLIKWLETSSTANKV
jgi:excisionase family DNA binding protein